MSDTAQTDYSTGGGGAAGAENRRAGNGVAFRNPDVAFLNADAFDRNVWCVLGVPIDIAAIDGAVSLIDRSIRQGRRLSFVTPNVNWLVRAWSEPAARREILNADLSLVDGAPLLAMARLLGAPAPARTAGSDVFEALRRRAAYDGRRIRVFFFGGRDGAAAAAARALDVENGPLEAAGWRNPGFGDVAAMSAPEHIDAINAARPDFVVVALGAAKGQAWIERNKARLNAPVTAHLGAVVDFTAGGIARAPQWVGRAGLEWLWRIKEEPSLWRRYYKDAIALARLALTRLTPQLGAARPIGPGAAGEATFAPSRGGAPAAVRLAGALGYGNLKTVRAAFRAAAAQGGDVRLDCSALKAVDRAFLGQVLMLEAALGEKGARLFADGADAALRRLFRANGMRYSQSGANTQEEPVHAAGGTYGGGVA